LRHPLDAVRVGDGRTAVLLHDEAHGARVYRPERPSLAG
jgi:hypothetical protein